MLAAIEFLAPLFLLATLAAVIPLVIHMLQRQRAPEMPFSTLRFLKLSVEKTARKRRLRDLWLLLLRMAVVVILALGLAKPFLRGSTKLFSNRAAAIVIILDNSPSMSLSDGGEVRFERARTLALKVLDQVREEDEVALLLTGGPSLQQELLYRRVENVQRLIEQARVCLSGADIPVALHRARRLLQQSESPNKEIYLITDLQRSGWQPGSAADDAAKPPGQTVEDEAEAADEQSDGPIPTVVIDVHRERPTNLSLETVEQQVAVPAVGLPVRIIATVRNGALSEQDAQVELTIDGQLIEQSETIRLAPGEKRAFEFLYTPQKAGIQEGRVALVGQDAGPIDNQRFFVLDTQSPVQVALVDQRSGEEVLYRSASYYLERALRPIREGQYAMEVTVLKPELLKDEPLANYSTVLCVDLTPPDDATLEALERYVSNGGTLFWVCGPNNDPDQMTGSEIYAGTFAFLPEDEETGWNWSFLDEKHPALAPLTKPPSLYLGVSVDRYMRLTWPEDRAVRVLARLDNGDPALVSHRVGSGTVYTLTTGAHAQWTSLPLRPIFVPLINRLILHSAERDRGPLEVMPGNRVPFRFANEPESVTVEIAMPGDAGSVRLKSQPKDEFQEVTFEQTDRAGVYHVKMIKAQHPRNYAFAVNFDPAEADPETLTPDELRQRLGEDVLIATDEASLADTIKRLHEGTPLMDWFLIAVLVGGVLEVLVANRMGQQEPLPLEGRKRSTIHDILRRAQTVHQLEGYGRSA